MKKKCLPIDIYAIPREKFDAELVLNQIPKLADEEIYALVYLTLNEPQSKENV